MIYTSSIFGPVGETWYLHLKRICPRGWAKGCWGLGGEDLRWGKGKYASLYMGSSLWDGLVEVWGCFSWYYNIKHISLRTCMHCMYWYGILKGTRTWCYNYGDGGGNTAHENFDIHAMCKMLLFWAKTGKTSAYFLRFDIKLKKSRSWFDLVTALISKLFSTSRLACLAR